MINNYMNQTASWQHVLSVNEYNEPVYETKSIKCRIETGNKLVRNKQGDEVVSNSTVFTLENVTEGDLINGEIVLFVATNMRLNGTVGFREAALI